MSYIVTSHGPAISLRLIIQGPGPYALLGVSDLSFTLAGPAGGSPKFHKNASTPGVAGKLATEKSIGLSGVHAGLGVDSILGFITILATAALKVNVSVHP